jgi:hypothetical protein
MTHTETLRLALEALGWTDEWRPQGLKEEAITAIKAALEAKDEPVAFKIYKPTPPRHAIPNVRDAELPWVYDQDPSSGNVASMWVTPVKATPPQRKSLTDEEIQYALEAEFLGSDAKRNWQDDLRVARAIEAAHGIKGEA